jgi:hypothetical protein
MVKKITLEQRLTTLEKAVYQIQYRLKNKSNSDNWLQQLSGSISDDELFLEALECGRSFRQSDQSIDKNKE